MGSAGRSEAKKKAILLTHIPSYAILYGEVIMCYTKQETTAELKPCPFCGGRGELIVLEHEGIPELEPIYFIRCYDCDACGSHDDNPFSAISGWNRERLDTAIRERAEGSFIGIIPNLYKT